MCTPLTATPSSSAGTAHNSGGQVAGAIYPADRGGQAQFRRFRHLLEADFAASHKVQHYAQVLGMSDKTLSRVCVAVGGMPAKAVINARLLLEAKRLLAHTAMPVQTVAIELGFDEATNFVKFFRKEGGTTPLAFRNQA